MATTPARRVPHSSTVARRYWTGEELVDATYTAAVATMAASRATTHTAGWFRTIIASEIRQVAAEKKRSRRETRAAAIEVGAPKRTGHTARINSRAIPSQRATHFVDMARPRRIPLARRPRSGGRDPQGASRMAAAAITKGETKISALAANPPFPRENTR